MVGGFTLSVLNQGAAFILRLVETGEEIASASTDASLFSDFAAFVNSDPDPILLGDRLGALLFPPPILGAFQLRSGRTLARGAIVWVTLDGPDLPWEWVRLTRDRPSSPFEGFLGLHPKVRLFRGPLPSESEPVVDREPRRILFCAADPGTAGFPRLGWLDAECRAVAAIHSARKPTVELRTIFDVVPAVLERALLEFRPHVLHFAGHGVTRLSGSYLVLQGEKRGSASLLDVRDLARWIEVSQTQLVVLSACESDASAELLCRSGLNSVLAMRGAMRDACQPSFMRTLYGALADGSSLGDAVAEARQAMPPSGTDWAVPVLRSRTDLRLFEAAGRGPTGPKLPYAERRIVGREREIARIVEILCSPNAGSVALTGLGGIGKTRLAVEAAIESAGTFPDGTFFVDCDGIGEPERMFVAILAALGIEPGGESPESAFRAAFRRTRRLLVLDCCDALVDAGHSELLASLPRMGGNGAAIITSRTSLRSTSDVSEILVESLAVAENPLDASASVELFIEAGGLGEKRLAAPSRRAIGEICSKLDGIPLAIVLCAAHAASLPLEELRDLVLRQPLRIASSGWSGTRHASVAEAIRRSMDLVPEADRRLLERLSVFVGGFAWGDAVAVLAGDALDLLDGLKRLTDCSLLRVDRSQERSRFRLLDAVRECIRVGVQEDEDLGRRHAQHFAAIVARVHQEGSGAFLPLRADLANFLAAARFADRSDMPREALRISEELCRTLFEAGLATDFGALLEIGKRAASVGRDLAAESRFLGLEGAHAARVGDEARCRQAWGRRADLCEEVGDSEGAADALIDLAVQEHEYGQPEACQTLLNLASERLGEGGSVELRATARVMQARLAADFGDLPAAERHAAAAVELVGSGARRDPILFVDLNVGRVWASCGKASEAEEVFVRLLRDSLRTDRRIHASLALIEMSGPHEAAGSIELGLLDLEAAVRIFEAAQSRYQTRAEIRLREYRARHVDHPAVRRERREPWTTIVDEVLSRMGRPPFGE